jgi:hypothetical protein
VKTPDARRFGADRDDDDLAPVIAASYSAFTTGYGPS